MEKFDEKIIVEIPSEDGINVKCEVLTVYEIDGIKYIALMPVVTDGTTDIQLFRYEEIDSGIEVFTIENDGEFETAFETFKQLIETEEQS